MKLFNTLSKKKELFKPKDKERVTLYTCGPTVYNYIHIGNLRTFVFEDILRRYLKYKGFGVKHVMNITDVEDKIIRDTQKQQIPLKEFTEKYTKAFFEDTDSLNIERAEVYPKATEHVSEMIAMIELLLKKGVAYKTEDGIYFSISKFKDYGKLAHLDVSNLKAGASGRVLSDEYEKENVADFALWKFWDKKDGDVVWNASFGKGRPGWHIECSAMSAKHLTDVFENSTFNPNNFVTIDIHTGGVDNLFPHHQDEVAQTESCVNKPFAKYWLHAEHLLVDNKKMSKSLGNFYTLRDIQKKSYDPLALRYLLLSVHYRQKMNFTFDSLDAATSAVQKINDFVSRLSECKGNDSNSKIEKLIEKAKKQFEKSMDDDLEISPALASLFDFMHEINKFLEKGELSKANAESVNEFIKNIDAVLGILKKEEKVSNELKSLLEERETARNKKDFKKADALRDKLKEKGIAVEDTPNGQRWKRIL